MSVNWRLTKRRFFSSASLSAAARSLLAMSGRLLQGARGTWLTVTRVGLPAVRVIVRSPSSLGRIVVQSAQTSSVRSATLLGRQDAQRVFGTARIRTALLGGLAQSIEH